MHQSFELTRDEIAILRRLHEQVGKNARESSDISRVIGIIADQGEYARKDVLSVRGSPKMAVAIAFLPALGIMNRMDWQSAQSFAETILVFGFVWGGCGLLVWLVLGGARVYASHRADQSVQADEASLEVIRTHLSLELHEKLLTRIVAKRKYVTRRLK